MKFTCSLCSTEGNIDKEDIRHPVTRATCRKCGAILFLDPDSGRVEKHKSPVKDTSRISREVIPSSQSVMDMPKGTDSRDWLAIAVVAVVLALFCGAGVYLVVHLDLI